MTLTAESMTVDEQRIYVACLAAYNNGILHGKWIEISDDIDVTWKEIRSVLASSPIPEAEEHAIHDYEGFGGVRISEYESIERIHELSEFLQEHGEAGALALAHHDGDLEAAEETVENYQGCFTSLADYAQGQTEDITEIPAHLENYIDYESMGRDMKLSGEIFAIQTRFDEVHVFLNY